MHKLNEETKLTSKLEAHSTIIQRKGCIGTSREVLTQKQPAQVSRMRNYKLVKLVISSGENRWTYDKMLKFAVKKTKKILKICLSVLSSIGTGRTP